MCVPDIFYIQQNMQWQLFLKDKKLPFSLVVSIFKEFYKLDGEYEK